jgi:hypothetical protein
VAGTYPFPNAAAGSINHVYAVVSVAFGTPVGTMKDCLVTATSGGDATQRDAVRFQVTAK